MVWRDLGYSVRSGRSVYDLGPLCVQLLEETANFLRALPLDVVNGFSGRAVSSAYFENMTIIDKAVRHDGIGSISFGGPVSGEWRWGRNNPPRPPTFDDIDSVDSVFQIAAGLREQTQKAGGPISSRWSS